MKNNYVFLLAVIAAALILCLTNFGESTGKVYDCSMAEWHPDIPTEVRDECRKLRYEQWKTDQEESKKKVFI